MDSFIGDIPSSGSKKNKSLLYNNGIGVGGGTVFKGVIVFLRDVITRISELFGVIRSVLYYSGFK